MLEDLKNILKNLKLFAWLLITNQRSGSVSAWL